MGARENKTSKASNFTKWNLTDENLKLPVFSQFLWNLKFIFSGSYKNRFFFELFRLTYYIYSRGYKRMRYGLKYSGTRFLSTEN